MEEEEEEDGGSTTGPNIGFGALPEPRAQAPAHAQLPEGFKEFLPVSF